MRWIAVVAAFALPGLAWAHDGHDHGAHKMMGTVTAVHVDKSHVEMTDGKTGKTVDFYVDAKTKIVKGTAAVPLQGLTPGTKVVVSGKVDGERLLASEVKVGGAAEPDATPAPNKQHPH